MATLITYDDVTRDFNTNSIRKKVHFNLAEMMNEYEIGKYHCDRKYSARVFGDQTSGGRKSAKINQ